MVPPSDKDCRENSDNYVKQLKLRRKALRISPENVKSFPDERNQCSVSVYLNMNASNLQRKFLKTNLIVFYSATINIVV